MESQNSFSELIDKFILLQSNALSIIQKINEAVISDNENITFTIKDMNSNEVTYNFPSFGSLKESINRIDSTLKSLMGIDGGETIMRMPDGTYNRIFTTKLAKEPANILNLAVPSNFNVKTNWFFESFLSPSMNVTFDVSKYIEQSAKRIVCKRVVAICDNIDKETYFDITYKGQNDISLTELYDDLTKKGIAYFEDEEVKDLPLSILQYEGTFDIINIKDVQTTDINGIIKTTRQYVLNKLTYNDVLTGMSDTLMIKIGDKIIRNETIYEITAVDASTNSITLIRLSGYDALTIGTDIIRIYSDSYAAKTAEIGISFNERQIIFFKAIEETNNIVAKTWSPGVGIFTNDLKIVTASGEQNLKTFYNDNVLDFSKAIMSVAKEKTVPSIYGEIPNTPYLSDTNFKVLRVNEHLFNAKDQETIKKKGADKIKLSAEIKQLELAIDKNKQILGNTEFKTDQERNAIKNKLDSLIKEKTSKSSLYSSIVNELTSIAKDYNVTTEKPKYRARAFFDMPSPKYNDFTGSQEVIQFEYAYRYLRLDNKPAQVNQIEFASPDNQIKRGSFSPWNYIKSDIRKRYFDYTAGIYKWSEEDVANPDVVNINQIDIPFNKGEKLEVKVRSYSEAGWPINPIMSDWTPSVIIDFPIDLLTSDETEIVLTQAITEEVQVKFEETLRSKNLDLHLETSSQTGDKYYSHTADVIASGFFNNAGLILSLYEKIKIQDSEIQQLKNLIEKKKGTLRVSIVEDGKTAINTYVSNGSVVDLFAGYYTDYIDQLSTNEKKGAIITKIYKLVLENTEVAPLELVSLLPGGLLDRLPENYSSSIYNQDKEYYQRLRYWEVPVNNLSIAAAETKNCNGIYANNVQSRQLRSQFIYGRKTNIGLVTELYKDDTIRHLEPVLVAPITTSTTSTPSWVWNGTYTGNTPNGGGVLSSFCIHTECPILYSNNNSEWSPPSPVALPVISGITQDWWKFFNQPIINLDVNNLPIPHMKSSAFRHAKYFNLESAVADGQVQLIHKDPWPFDPATGIPVSYSASGTIPGTVPPQLYFHGQQGSGIDINKYQPILTELPDKLGFYPHDRYLVGSDTCGAYLFMAPAYFDQILVDGADYRSIRDIPNGIDKAIVIPIVFQFRMVDYYGEPLGTVNAKPTDGKIAGDITGNTKNVMYTKKMGFDIYIKDAPRFSFDINVSAKYSKKTQAEKVEISKNVSQKPANISTNKINLSTL